MRRTFSHFQAARTKGFFRPVQPNTVSDIPSPSRSIGDAPDTPDTTKSEARSGVPDASVTHIFLNLTVADDA
jgi:hypothetical protein